MAQGKKSFVLDNNLIYITKLLNNEQLGRLFKSILLFVNNLDYTIDNDIEIYFNDIKNKIEIEWLKYNPKTNKYHWNYKGGITNKNHSIRNSTQMVVWRNSVFERDNYTCQKCKITGGVLNAHHIKPFSEFPLLRFDINNGITLCKPCHLLEHKKIKNG